MKSTINERVRILINELSRGDQSKFSVETGIPASTLSSIVGSRQTKPTFDVLYKIASKFDNVNFNWLIKGEGEKLIEPHGSHTLALEQPRSNPSTDDEFWKEQMRVKDQIILDASDRLKRCEEEVSRLKNNTGVSYNPQLGKQKKPK